MTDVRLYACCITPEIPAMLLILGVGLYLTVRLGVPQLVLLPRALRLFFRRLFFPEKKEGVSSFQALCTALAATVGTGNLVGVAGAICLGGPGAIFWMWVCGFLGNNSAILREAAVQRYIPEALRARVNALFDMMLTAASGVCALAVGALGEVLDYRLCVTMCGAVAMAACWLLIWGRRTAVRGVYEKEDAA